MAKPEYKFFVDSEFAVVGYNFEMADQSNPRGEHIELRYYMVAEDKDGLQVRFGFEETEEKAEEVFIHFAPPVSEWSYFRCVYGSVAYQRENCELETMIWEVESDSEFGPDYWQNRSGLSHMAAAY